MSEFYSVDPEIDEYVSKSLRNIGMQHPDAMHLRITIADVIENVRERYGFEVASRIRVH